MLGLRFMKKILGIVVLDLNFAKLFKVKIPNPVLTSIVLPFIVSD